MPLLHDVNKEHTLRPRAASHHSEAKGVSAMADEQQTGGLSLHDMSRAGGVVGVGAAVGGVTAGEAAAAGAHSRCSASSAAP